MKWASKKGQWQYYRWLGLLAIGLNLTTCVWLSPARSQENPAPPATPAPVLGPFPASASPTSAPESSSPAVSEPAPSNAAESPEAAQPVRGEPDETASPTSETEPGESATPNELPAADAADGGLETLTLIPDRVTAERLERLFGLRVQAINTQIAQHQTDLQKRLADLTSSDDEIRRLQAELSQLRVERDRLAIEHLLLMRQVTEKLVFPESFDSPEEPDLQPEAPSEPPAASGGS